MSNYIKRLKKLIFGVDESGSVSMKEPERQPYPMFVLGGEIMDLIYAQTIFIELINAESGYQAKENYFKGRVFARPCYRYQHTR